MSGPTNNVDELHARAMSIYKLKIRRIPAGAFFLGRRPTLVEIYKETDLHNPLVHKDCQLPMILSNYNGFATANFRACKKEQEASLTLALWSWSMDRRHCLSSRNKQVRCNLILAILKLSSSNPAANIGKAAVQFIRAFSDAWMLHSTRKPISGNEDPRVQFITATWKNDAYDLIFWKGTQMKRMSTAVKKLTQAVPALPCPAADFWAFIQHQPKDECEKHGAAWAMQYLLHVEREEEKALEADKDEERLRSLDEDTWMEDLDRWDVSEGGPPPHWLTVDYFEKPTVKALMIPIDENVQKSEHDRTTFWMKSSEAVNLLEGKVVGIDSLAQSLEQMSFL